MNKFVAYSVSDVVKIISDLSDKHEELWFRGQSNAEYELEPGLMRHKREVSATNENDKLLRKYTREIHYDVPSFKVALDIFKRKAKPFLSYKPENDFEWMFIMQHYGVPTRLLDWSTNALIALYFALNGKISIDKGVSTEDGVTNFLEDKDSSQGVAVFIINPYEINEVSNHIDGILDVSENAEQWIHYLHPNGTIKSDFPICISANHIDNRIRSQSGMFTLHGNRVESLEWYTALNKLINKIYIPYSCVSKMKKELKILGITNSFVFPDLDGLSKEITDDIVGRFENKI